MYSTHIDEKNLVILRKVHYVKSYKELCALIHLIPAKRGPEREAQFNEIKRYYNVKRNNDNSYSISFITEDDRKRANGQIITLDGKEVDLLSPNLYANTGIYDYINYRLIMNADSSKHRKQTKQTLVLDCFCRTKLARYLLNKYNTFALARYSDYALSLMDKYVIHRLYDLVDTQIERLVAEDILCADYYYIDNDKQRICLSKEDMDSIERQALSSAGCENTYQVYQSKATKEIFTNTRNSLVLAKTGKEVFVSRYNVNFSENITQDKYQSYRDMFYVDSEESQIILTKFFDAFRKKAYFCLKRDIENSDDPVLTRFDGGWQALRIIDEYCAYMYNAPSSSYLKSQVFYSLEQLKKWQETLKHSYTKYYDDNKYAYVGYMNLYNIQNFLSK